ncbi:MAG: LUD domain-containing protein, partial [Myxococcota bacterium]|nr:LUD domain-containing protein [Myxococcota bacterium]
PGTALPADPETFGRALSAAGGALVGPVPYAALGAGVAELVGSLAGGERVVAARAATAWLRGAPFSFEVAASDAAPASFADVAVAILRGEVAVAESGAVALLASDAPARSLAFLCAHLVLLVERERLVPDLHAAFAALPEEAWRGHHLTWVAGPSKTADIEQTLVLGAHGPLTLDVVMVESGPAA